MTEKQLIELLDRYGPQIRDAVLNGIRDVRDNAVLSQLIEMIERDDINGVLRALGYNPAVFSTYYFVLAQTFEAGGLALMATLPKYTADRDGVKSMMRFNVRDPIAEKWLQDQSSSLVTGIDADIRAAVRETLRAGAAEGRNPRNVALDLVGRYDRTTGHREGGAVGLGERELMWANSARTRLLNLDPSYFTLSLRDKRFDATVQKAIDSGQPLPAGVVDKLVDRYRSNALRFRGETIGRTEALAALNKSEYEATRQALAQSDLPLAAAQKVWDSAGDARVRNSHQALDGQRVGIDEPFVSPVTGARLMHPHDSSLGAPGSETISCRCRVRYKIDFAYGVK